MNASRGYHEGNGRLTCARGRPEGRQRVEPTRSELAPGTVVLGASYVFSLSPLSRASRPFIGPSLKGSNGSIPAVQPSSGRLRPPAAGSRAPAPSGGEAPPVAGRRSPATFGATKGRQPQGRGRRSPRQSQCDDRPPASGRRRAASRRVESAGPPWAEKPRQSQGGDWPPPVY